MTHTYATLEVSPSTYREIQVKLHHAGYADNFHKTDNGVLIDMHGIALSTTMPRELAHFRIPGQPKSWERVGWNRGKSYNPNSQAKSDFLWNLKTIYPRLTPDMLSRIGVHLEVYIGHNHVSSKGKQYSQWHQDIDNYAKFYLDALKINKEGDYGLWGDDRQVDELTVKLHRSAEDPNIEILAYEVAQELKLR